MEETTFGSSGENHNQGQLSNLTSDQCLFRQFPKHTKIMNGGKVEASDNTTRVTGSAPVGSSNSAECICTRSKDGCLFMAASCNTKYAHPHVLFRIRP